MDKTMETKLRSAAVRGETTVLSQLLREDPHLIDESYVNCENKNVLHISAMFGHAGFVKEILKLGSPAAHDMCLARDRDGRNPVHLAAIHGRLSVLELVKEYDMLKLAALEKVDDGGTILHLCVKFNQLEALEFLLGTFCRVRKFVGARNNDGMTILHMALQNNQHQRFTMCTQRRRQIILHLIKNAHHIINKKNASGKTALDLYFKHHDSSSDQEMIAAFSGHGATISKTLPSRYLEKFEDNRNGIMVAASIIATVAFQAMINPPGGVWQENQFEGPRPHVAGESVMAQTHPKQYNALVFYVTGALISSLATIFLHLISGLMVKNRFMLTMVLFTQCGTILASGFFICIAYGYCFESIVPQSSKWHMTPAIATPIIVVSVISTPVLSYILVRLMNKVIYGAWRRLNLQRF